MTHSDRLPHAALWLAACGLVMTGHLSSAWSQKAAYLVQSKVDVDGDGRIDELRIDEGGTISVDIAGRAKDGAWTALAASGKIVGGSLQVDRKLDPKGRTLIVARSAMRTSRGQRHEEAVILAWTPGRLETLWRGAVGTTGRDGAKHTSIELGKFGLIKYASRQGVDRCDGETAHLDAKRYDFASGSFRSVRQAVRVSAGAETPVLHATNKAKDPRWASAQSFWFRPVSASSSAQAATAAELVAPLALSDGDDKTAWIESKGGFGKGEFVTLKSSVGPVNIKALRLVLGHGAAKTDYNRPKRLALVLGKTQKFWIEFDKDPKGEQWIELPAAVASKCVSLIIDDVYPRAASKGNKGRTAISEISIVSEEDLDPALAGALLADRISQGQGGADTKRLLDGWGPAAAPALQKAITASKDSKSRLRLRLALARIPAAAEELIAGLSAGSLQSGQLRTLEGGLKSLGDNALPALQAALQDSTLSLQGSESVVRVLSTMGDVKATEALVHAVGSGSSGQRAALVKALARVPEVAPLLAQALAASEAGVRQADLYRASGLANAQLPSESQERQNFAAQLSEALGSSAGDLDASAYETRYRMLQAAAQVGGELLSTTLLVALQSPAVPKEARHAVLLRLQVAALAAMVATRDEQGVKADLSQALKQALRHSDPGVRLAVINNIGSSKAVLGAQSLILKEDSWPEVRRSAAASLTQHCQTDTARVALEASTRTDLDEEVARTSLSALLRCKVPGLLALMLDLIDDKKRPTELRLVAARNVGGVAQGAESSQVLSRFKRARTWSLTDATSAKIASALTVSLADVASAEAIDNLEDSALDPAVPQLQAAALTALAKLCRPSSKPILRKLKRSSDPTVSQAARRASGRCN